MTGATSPTIRARIGKLHRKASGANSKYKSVNRPGPRRSTSSSSSVSSHSNKTAKRLLSPYVVGVFLVILSGGAFFQVLRLFGLGVDEDNF
ncbi:hypothetical protein BGZ93_003142 [Podila epicladia]|nr:hypothetical protein BGZ92_001046 [Podila epicladia]KAG0097254.1 hypothetical protein BGZ93_003142 [Podila epicladia]